MGMGCGETRARETGGWGPVAGAVGRARPLWSAGVSAVRKCGPCAAWAGASARREGARERARGEKGAGPRGSLGQERRGEAGPAAGRGKRAAGWFVELGWVEFGSLGWFDSSLFLPLFPFLFLTQTQAK